MSILTLANAEIYHRISMRGVHKYPLRGAEDQHTLKVYQDTLTASSRSFPVLFFPGDFDGEGEGDGRGAESVSSCSISFSSFINPGGSTPNLLKA